MNDEFKLILNPDLQVQKQIKTCSRISTVIHNVYVEIRRINFIRSNDPFSYTFSIRTDYLIDDFVLLEALEKVFIFNDPEFWDFKLILNNKKVKSGHLIDEDISVGGENEINFRVDLRKDDFGEIKLPDGDHMTVWPDRQKYSDSGSYYDSPGGDEIVISDEYSNSKTKTINFNQMITIFQMTSSKEQENRFYSPDRKKDAMNRVFK